MNDRNTEMRLAEAEYRMVLAPALEAAAEQAARRNDPYLYNDMASMLALMAMVTGLVECYRADRGSGESGEEAMRAAPLAACALVLTESDLSGAQMDECLQALHSAWRLLERDGIVGGEGNRVRPAWDQLANDRRTEARDRLLVIANDICSAIDRWERERADSA